MCLVVNNKTPHVAQEDIQCYKVVKQNLKSDNRGFQYKMKKKYRLVFGFGIRHYYEDSFQIEHGFHSYITFQQAESNRRGGNGIVVPCVIPKGAKYYKSAHYVSNRLIFGITVGEQLPITAIQKLKNVFKRKPKLSNVKVTKEGEFVPPINDNGLYGNGRRSSETPKSSGASSPVNYKHLMTHENNVKADTTSSKSVSQTQG